MKFRADLGLEIQSLGDEITWIFEKAMKNDHRSVVVLISAYACKGKESCEFGKYTSGFFLKKEEKRNNLYWSFEDDYNSISCISLIILLLWCWYRSTHAKKKKVANPGSKHWASCQRKRRNEITCIDNSNMNNGSFEIGNMSNFKNCPSKKGTQ